MPKLPSLKTVTIAGALLAMSGCATVQIGREFDPEKFEAWVKRGETSLSDVKNFLGDPVSTGIVVEHDGSRYQRWTYYHAKSRLHKLGEAKLKMLEIRFDKQQKVDSYNWTAE